MQIKLESGLTCRWATPLLPVGTLKTVYQDEDVVNAHRKNLKIPRKEPLLISGHLAESYKPIMYIVKQAFFVTPAKSVTHDGRY